VFLDLIEPREREQCQRVLLAVHHASLKRRIEFAVVDTYRGGAERCEDGNLDPADWHANLETVHVIGRGNGTRARRDDPETVVHWLGKRVQSRLGDALAHKGA